MIQIIRLLIPAFILSGSVFCFFSCNNKAKTVVQNFGMLSMQVPDKYVFKKIDGTHSNKNLSTWRLVCYPDSCQIRYYNLEEEIKSDTVQYGYGTKSSLSLFDLMYNELPPSDWKKDKFSITYPIISGSKARLILAERKQRVIGTKMDDLKAIERKTIYGLELSFKGVCNQKNMFDIFSQSMNEETNKELQEAIKTISFTCQ